MVKNRDNLKFLRYTDEDTQQHGFLQYTGETVISPHARFEVQQSRTGGGLVHLRCAYNNKYWVRTSETELWFAAAADASEEDQSKWSCTLFRPVIAGAVNNDHGSQNLLLRFLHVQLNRYVSLSQAPAPMANFAVAGSSPSDPTNWRDMCEVLNCESLLVLPWHVAFKGDNERFLRARVIERFNYHEFAGTTISEAQAGNEVFQSPDGSVRIRSNHYGRFWRRSPNWIWGDSTDATPNNRDTVFWPVRAARGGPNVVALRNAGNDRFCRRLTTEGKTNCLNAADETLTALGVLEVGEWVRKRSISDVQFNLLDARIYNQTPRTLARTVVNNDSSQTNTPVIRFRFRNTISRHWQSTVSFSYGLSSTVSAGIPLFTNASLTVQWEASSEYAWGQTIETSEEQEQEYPVTVGPYTRATITFQATEGFCDVPFSYTQTDELFDDRIVTTRMHDGLYTGANLYEYTWTNTEESLTPDEINKLAQEEERVGKKKNKKDVELKVELGEAEIVERKEEEEDVIEKLDYDNKKEE
ncbi:unnamed protein product [Linum tenue]|uniref:Agglutinin domain-containing protein n=1 Tax=Linum tenue TaxID=586396 RepID=A0AAV0RJE0_9ROSI|nr:unnamed protein product [Linum tenue]